MRKIIFVCLLFFAASASAEIVFEPNSSVPRRIQNEMSQEVLKQCPQLFHKEKLEIVKTKITSMLVGRDSTIHVYSIWIEGRGLSDEIDFYSLFVEVENNPFSGVSVHLDSKEGCE